MATAIRPIDGHDIVRWPDGCWCYGNELCCVQRPDDNLEVLPPDHPEYDLLATQRTAEVTWA